MKGALDHKSLKLEELIDDRMRESLRACEGKKAYADGALIYSQGDPADSFLLIHSGSVRIARTTPDGREMTLAVLGPGHFVGLAGIFTGKRAQGATANGATSVGVISRESFDALLREHPQLAVNLLPALISRLRAATSFIDDVKRLPVSVHTAAILEQLLDAADHPHLIGWSQSDIALALGSSRVSVGKALKELEKQGLIKLSYAQIEVPDAKRLADWVTDQRNRLIPLD